MSYARYATPLRLELRRSRCLLTVLIVLHGGAMLIPWLLPLSWPWCLPCSVLIAVAGVRAGAVHGWGGRSVAALCWEAGERWRLTLRDGSIMDCRLLPGSYVLPRFAVLRFVPAEATDEGSPSGMLRRWAASLRRVPARVVMLTDDGVDAEPFRRLRVRLRLEGPGEDSGKGPGDGRAAFSGPRAG